MKKLFTYFLIVAISCASLLGKTEKTEGDFLTLQIETQPTIAKTLDIDKTITTEASTEKDITLDEAQQDRYDEAKQELIDYYKKIYDSEDDLELCLMEGKTEGSDALQDFFNKINPKSLKKETKQLIIKHIKLTAYHNLPMAFGDPPIYTIMQDLFGPKYIKKYDEMINAQDNNPERREQYNKMREYCKENGIEPKEIERPDDDDSSMFIGPLNHLKNLDEQSENVLLEIETEISNFIKKIEDQLGSKKLEEISKDLEDPNEPDERNNIVDNFMFELVTKLIAKTTRCFSEVELYKIVFENDEDAKELRLSYLDNILDNFKRGEESEIHELIFQIANLQLMFHYPCCCHFMPQELNKLDYCEALAFEILSMSEKAKDKDFDLDNVIKFKKATDSIFNAQ